MILQDLNKHYLYPGGIFISQQRYEITTVLGSCISICLYDTKLKFGGMNHFMLPTWNGSGLATPKYGNIANETLYNNMLMNGSLPENIIAKVFGGAEVLDNDTDMFRIGKRNIESAFTFLNKNGIFIKAFSTGGKQGRKIIFNNYTGEVKHKLFLNNKNNKDGSKN